jgi:anti-anti-sigma regulatory factor
MEAGGRITTTRREDGTVAVRVEGALTIWEVPRVRLQLLEARGVADKVTLDLSAGAGIDAAGLQLVCAAHRSADRVGASFTLEASPEVLAVASEAGFLRRSGCFPTCVWRDGGQASAVRGRA